MNHRDTLIKRLNSDTFLNFMDGLGIKCDTSLDLLECIDKRVFNGFTQKEVATFTGRSLATIKRFEQGKVDSLFLYMFYIDRFKALPNRKKALTPKWVNY